MSVTQPPPSSNDKTALDVAISALEVAKESYHGLARQTMRPFDAEAVSEHAHMMIRALAVALDLIHEKAEQ